MVENDPEEWRSYDEFAAGIDTYRLPDADARGLEIAIELDGGGRVEARIDGAVATWSASGIVDVPAGTVDPVDAVEVRPGVFFVDLARESAPREKLTLLIDGPTGRVIVVRSVIAVEPVPGEPQVRQEFRSGVVVGTTPSGDRPGPSRELVGHRNLYRYSPEHLYEHVYLSSRRYSWQCLQGVQRGHGDTDLSTVWRLGDGLVLFCFREFRIPVASVWLHDFVGMRTTGVFLGLTGEQRAEHSRAGGYIIPLGAVTYPDVQPV